MLIHGLLLFSSNNPHLPETSNYSKEKMYDILHILANNEEYFNFLSWYLIGMMENWSSRKLTCLVENKNDKIFYCLYKFTSMSLLHNIINNFFNHYIIIKNSIIYIILPGNP